MIENIHNLALGMGLVMLFGCGSGSSSTGSTGGGTAFKTSLSGSKMLTALTASDKLQLCADLSTFLTSSSVRMSECRLVGNLGAAQVAASDDTITDANLQAACTASYAACISQSTDAGLGAVTCEIDMAVPATCLATVADYSACINDYPQILGGSAPACNTLTRASLSRDAGVATTTTSGLPNTAACDAFVAKCSDVATGSTALMSKVR